MVELEVHECEGEVRCGSGERHGQAGRRDQLGVGQREVRIAGRDLESSRRTDIGGIRPALLRRV